MVIFTKEYQEHGDDEIFSKIWCEETQVAREIGVEEPRLQRTRNPPKHLEYKSNATQVFSTTEEYFRKNYFQILDTTITSLNDRFESDTMNLLNKFENFILDVKGVTDSHYEEITDFYNVRFDNKENADPVADSDYSSLKRERDLFVHTLKKDKIERAKEIYQCQAEC